MREQKKTGERSRRSVEMRAHQISAALTLGLPIISLFSAGDCAKGTNYGNRITNQVCFPNSLSAVHRPALAAPTM